MLGREREGQRMQQACSHAAARHRDAFLLLSPASASATASSSAASLQRSSLPVSRSLSLSFCPPFADRGQDSCAGAVPAVANAAVRPARLGLHAGSSVILG